MSSNPTPSLHKKTLHQNLTKVRLFINSSARDIIFLHRKTDRYLYTRINEHAKSDKSEIYNHVHVCEHFQHVFSLLNLPSNLLDVKCTISVILNNCYIIDRSNNWSLLLFKEAYRFLSIIKPPPGAYSFQALLGGGGRCLFERGGLFIS